MPRGTRDRSRRRCDDRRGACGFHLNSYRRSNVLVVVKVVVVLVVVEVLLVVVVLVLVDEVVGHRHSFL